MAGVGKAVVAASNVGADTDIRGLTGLQMASPCNGEILDDTHVLEGRIRSSSLPGLQSSDGQAKKKTFMSSLRRKFSRKGMKRPLCPAPPTKQDSSISSSPLVRTNGVERLSRDVGNDEAPERNGAADKADGMSAEQGQSEQRSGHITGVSSTASDSAIVDAGREDRPPLAAPKPVCRSPPRHSLGPKPSVETRPPTESRPPVETRPASTAAVATTVGSGGEHGRWRTAGHAAQPNFEDNVYENTAALVNAFGPMRDVGRWYSVYHQHQRQRRTHGGGGGEGESVYDQYGDDGQPAVRPRRGPLQLPRPEGPMASARRNDSLDDAEIETGVYVTLPPSTAGAEGVMCPQVTLSNNVRVLAGYSWYWGPVSRQEAESLLADQKDGTFLVRDSSDERYLLSLTFRSQGRTLHTRIEHHLGRFSFYAMTTANYDDGCPSVGGLIERSMFDSRDGAFCFSRQRFADAPSIPVRLMAPYSRRSVVRSLQHICRFVIRQHTRYDLITDLPLPNIVKEYLRENRF